MAEFIKNVRISEHIRFVFRTGMGVLEVSFAMNKNENKNKILNYNL